MKRNLSSVLVCALLAVVPISGAEVDAQSIFDQLTTLTGTWQGVPEGEGERAADVAEMRGEVVHKFEVSAVGTVVMETMNPNTDEEMVNMYHVDGEDLVLTHYCSGGNQPSLRLDREESTAGTWVFNFSGGTNLNPAVDQHIHGTQVTLIDSDHIESVWTSYVDGERAGEMTFHLVRSK